MKKINLVYLLFFILLGYLFFINQNNRPSSFYFFGFAENKETELNQDFDVLITNILVTTGQEVNEGDLLMEVYNPDFENNILKLTSDINRKSESIAFEQLVIQHKIDQLKSKRESVLQAKESELLALNNDRIRKQNIYGELQSLDMPFNKDSLHMEYKDKIQLLEEKYDSEITSIDLQISQLESSLVEIRKPHDKSIQFLESEIDSFKKYSEKQKIFAPTDGLIGNIHCKQGEFIKSFSTLLSFYERNPTLVKGFVHESLILKVNVGDQLEVASSLHPDNVVLGTVTGLGSRIVEIPSRLRKNPDFKTYGREILISIPVDNSFLQKEKVILKPLENEENSNLWSLFH